MVLLFLFGNINAAFFTGEILVLYSIIGFVLIGFCRLSTRVVLGRRSVEQDARLKQLVLTEKGRQFHGNTMLALHQTDEYVASLLTEEENTELLRLLRKD